MSTPIKLDPSKIAAQSATALYEIFQASADGNVPFVDPNVAVLIIQQIQAVAEKVEIPEITKVYAYTVLKLSNLSQETNEYQWCAVNLVKSRYIKNFFI